MPSYMVPNVFFQLDSLPLNINKKIDKQELLRLFMLSRDSKIQQKTHSIAKQKGFVRIFWKVR